MDCSNFLHHHIAGRGVKCKRFSGFFTNTDMARGIKIRFRSEKNWQENDYYLFHDLLNYLIVSSHCSLLATQILMLHKTFNVWVRYFCGISKGASMKEMAQLLNNTRQWYVAWAVQVHEVYYLKYNCFTTRYRSSVNLHTIGFPYDLFSFAKRRGLFPWNAKTHKIRKNTRVWFMSVLNACFIKLYTVCVSLVVYQAFAVIYLLVLALKY